MSEADRLLAYAKALSDFDSYMKTSRQSLLSANSTISHSKIAENTRHGSLAVLVNASPSEAVKTSDAVLLSSGHDNPIKSASMPLEMASNSLCRSIEVRHDTSPLESRGSPISLVTMQSSNSPFKLPQNAEKKAGTVSVKAPTAVPLTMTAFAQLPQLPQLPQMANSRTSLPVWRPNASKSAAATLPMFNVPVSESNQFDEWQQTTSSTLPLLAMRPVNVQHFDLRSLPAIPPSQVAAANLVPISLSDIPACGDLNDPNIVAMLAELWTKERMERKEKMERNAGVGQMVYNPTVIAHSYSTFMSMPVVAAKKKPAAAARKTSKSKKRKARKRDSDDDDEAEDDDSSDDPDFVDIPRASTVTIASAPKRQRTTTVPGIETSNPNVLCWRIIGENGSKKPDFAGWMCRDRNCNSHPFCVYARHGDDTANGYNSFGLSDAALSKIPVPEFNTLETVPFDHLQVRGTTLIKHLSVVLHHKAGPLPLDADFVDRAFLVATHLNTVESQRPIAFNFLRLALENAYVTLDAFATGTICAILEAILNDIVDAGEQFLNSAMMKRAENMFILLLAMPKSSKAVMNQAERKTVPSVFCQIFRRPATRDRILLALRSASMISYNYPAVNNLLLEFTAAITNYRPGEPRAPRIANFCTDEDFKSFEQHDYSPFIVDAFLDEADANYVYVREKHDVFQRITLEDSKDAMWNEAHRLLQVKKDKKENVFYQQRLVITTAPVSIKPPRFVPMSSESKSEVVKDEDENKAEDVEYAEEIGTGNLGMSSNFQVSDNTDHLLDDKTLSLAVGLVNSPVSSPKSPTRRLSEGIKFPSSPAFEAQPLPSLKSLYGSYGEEYDDVLRYHC